MGRDLEAYGALVLRIFLGVIYLAHAYLHLFVMGPAGAIGYQRALHIPLPEIGEWYLILAHVPIIAGALWFVHLPQGFFIFGTKNGYEYVLLLLGATVAQALLGAGAFTLKK